MVARDEYDPRKVPHVTLADFFDGKEDEEAQKMFHARRKHREAQEHRRSPEKCGIEDEENDDTFGDPDDTLKAFRAMLNEEENEDTFGDPDDTLKAFRAMLNEEILRPQEKKCRSPRSWKAKCKRILAQAHSLPRQ